MTNEINKEDFSLKDPNHGRIFKFFKAGSRGTMFGIFYLLVSVFFLLVLLGRRINKLTKGKKEEENASGA